MNGKTAGLFVGVTAVILAGVAHSQISRPGVGPTSPNDQNQHLQTQLEIELLDEKRLLEERRQHEAAAKFMKAIKPRKDRFPDFDQVVIRSKTPVSPTMLAIMAESPYAADIAYYLGKHQEQSKAISQMGSTDAGSALHQIELTLVNEDVAKK